MCSIPIVPYLFLKLQQMKPQKTQSQPKPKEGHHSTVVPNTKYQHLEVEKRDI